MCVAGCYGIFFYYKSNNIFFGLYVKSLRKEALIAGLLGILMVEYTNHFGAITSSLFNIPIFGSLYVAVVALAFNLIISFSGSSILNRRSKAIHV
jgi:uncharacterized membrane protein YjjP (DUF1212 family)